MTPVRLLLVLFLWQSPDGAVAATPYGRFAVQSYLVPLGPVVLERSRPSKSGYD